MNRNQQPQMPVNQQQVPDQRVQDQLNQAMERLRQLELQNTQLRTTVDYLKQPQQGQPANEQPLFKPEVEQAIMKVVQSRLQPMEQQFRQQVGFLADQLDEARFQVNYGTDKFKTYLPKVEQIRQQALAENRYITREDALRLVYFEETGKKNVEPQPQPQAQQQQPKFDPYFGTMVDPQTGKPVAQPQEFAPEEAEQQQTMQQPAHNMQPQQQPMPWQQPPQQFQQPQPQAGFGPGALPNPNMGNHPHGNAYGQHFQLPQQGVNQPMPPAHQQGNGRNPLSLESSDADLQAFENNFGDIPL